MTTKPMPCALPVLNDDERAYLWELHTEHVAHVAQRYAAQALIGESFPPDEKELDARRDFRSALGFNDREKEEG